MELQDHLPKHRAGKRRRDHIRSGELHDEAARDRALVGGLAELGWNKALDAAGHADEVIRAREREDLNW